MEVECWQDLLVPVIRTSYVSFADRPTSGEARTMGSDSTLFIHSSTSTSPQALTTGPNEQYMIHARSTKFLKIKKRGEKRNEIIRPVHPKPCDTIHAPSSHHAGPIGPATSLRPHWQSRFRSGFQRFESFPPFPHLSPVPPTPLPVSQPLR